jgi:hypothetical protein
MSPIDALKSEAAALRERQNAAGLLLKHSDALEIVAKKHGYSNWRACCAILAAAPPSPTETPNDQIAQTPALAEEPRASVPVDAQQFDRYVGFYQIGRLIFVAVTRLADRFFFQFTGQPEVEIYPESPNEFFAKVIGAKVVFSIDEEGATRGLVLHQNGLERHGYKVDESVVQASRAALAERISNNTPDPEREAPLRRNIEGLIKGQPTLDDMAPALAAVTNKQWPAIQKQFQGAGALISLVFEKVDDRGWDAYIAAFENKVIKFLIGPLDSERKIQGLVMYPAPDEALVGRIKANTPDPDREAPLRRNIDGLIKGQPVHDDMAPALSALASTQWPAIQKQFQGAGALRSLIFKRVDERGWDAYVATFENRRIEFLIAPLDSDKKVQGLLMRPALE